MSHLSPRIPPLGFSEGAKEKEKQKGDIPWRNIERRLLGGINRNLAALCIFRQTKHYRYLAFTVTRHCVEIYPASGKLVLYVVSGTGWLLFQLAGDSYRRMGVWMVTSTLGAGVILGWPPVGFSGCSWVVAFLSSCL